MKYQSWSCKLCTKVFFILAYIFMKMTLVVNAESAELSTDILKNENMEVQVISGRNVEKVNVTHSEPRRVDGIYYTILSVDGERAYCIQSSKDTPEEAVYEVEEKLTGTDSFLNKVMYYAYGNPGYRADIWIPDCPEDTERAYLSYVYDPANTLKREISDANWEQWWKNYINETIKKIEREPDIPVSAIRLERTEDTAYFDENFGMQRTVSNRIIGDQRNQVTVSLPQNVILVNETTGMEYKESGVLRGGDMFYFKAGVNVLNGERTVFENLKGSIQNDWATLVVKTGEDKQNLGYGVWYAAETGPLSLGIEWIPAPELEIVKEAKEEERIYKKGEFIEYELTITQKTENAVAKGMVIEDTILTEGAQLVLDSIKVFDGEINEIIDVDIVEKENGFIISGGDVLEYLTFNGDMPGIIVEYQVQVISDTIEIVENVAKVRSENTPEDEDEEDVPVEPEPEPIPEPEPEETVPKTGDNTNLIVLILSMLLSCFIIVKCGRITHRK